MDMASKAGQRLANGRGHGLENARPGHGKPGWPWPGGSQAMYMASLAGQWLADGRGHDQVQDRAWQVWRAMAWPKHGTLFHFAQIAIGAV